jgi:DNA-binding transcriptional LysR family regulator
VNLTWLQTFVLIVEKKSLTRAARALHLTQPAVSKQLNSLEKFYGVPLLYRTSRNMEITEAGKVVYNHCRRILSTVKESLVEVQALEKDLRGNLLLGASTIPGEYILPAALGCFQNLHPQLNVKLEIAGSAEIARLVTDGVIEAAVIGAISTNPALKQELIYQDQLVIIAPNGHLLTEKKRVALEDLIAEPFIVREKGSGTRMVIEHKLENKGISPDQLKVRLELGSTEAVINAVAAGLGISLVSRFAVEKRIQRDEIALIDIEELSLERGIYFIMRQDQILTPVMESFHHFLKDYLVNSALP